MYRNEIAYNIITELTSDEKRLEEIIRSLNEVSGYYYDNYFHFDEEYNVVYTSKFERERIISHSLTVGGSIIKRPEGNNNYQASDLNNIEGCKSEFRKIVDLEPEVFNGVLVW